LTDCPAESRKNIFEKYIFDTPVINEEGTSFAELYSELTGCPITEESNRNVTSSVCDQCSDLLTAVYEFKKRSLEIETKVQEHIKYIEENEIDYIEEIEEILEDHDVDVDEFIPLEEEKKQVYLIYDEPEQAKEITVVDQEDEKPTLMYISKTEDGDKFICPNCKGVYKTKKSLKKHLRQVLNRSGLGKMGYLGEI
jgi:hypothetical protein